MAGSRRYGTDLSDAAWAPVAPPPPSALPGGRRPAAHDGPAGRGFARELERTEGWRLVVVKRRERAFRVVGLARTVERSSARPGRSRRLSKDYEYRVQTAETMVGIAAIRLMLNRLVPA